MVPDEFDLDVVSDDMLTTDQHDFVAHWSRFYFGEIDALSRNTDAPVFRRAFLRLGTEILGHVATVKLNADVGLQSISAGGIDGLVIPLALVGRGFGGYLMDKAEDILFQELGVKVGLLFCFPETVQYFAARQWHVPQQPVSFLFRLKPPLSEMEPMVRFGAGVSLNSFPLHVRRSEALEPDM